MKIEIEEEIRRNYSFYKEVFSHSKVLLDLESHCFNVESLCLQLELKLHSN